MDGNTDGPMGLWRARQAQGVGSRAPECDGVHLAGAGWPHVGRAQLMQDAPIGTIQ